MSNFLLQEQKKFDEIQFDQAEWQTEQWIDQKTRHIALHVGKAAGKLIGIKSESREIIAADLSIYRSQLINTHDINPSLVENLPVVFADIPAEQSTVAAFAHLSNYLEPGEHGIVKSFARDHHTLEAARHLHHAATAIATEQGLNRQVLHLNRLRQNLGSRATLLD